MVRSIIFVGVLLASPLALVGQDSGPGPVAPATSQTYEVSLYSRTGVTDGVFGFSDGQSPSGPSTTGAIEATIGADAFSGDWFAYDLGQFAIWAAQGTGEAGNLVAIGYATPDWIVGRASVGATRTSFWPLRFLSRKTYVFMGQAVVEEP